MKKKMVLTVALTNGDRLVFEDDIQYSNETRDFLKQSWNNFISWFKNERGGCTFTLKYNESDIIIRKDNICFIDWKTKCSIK